MEKTGVKIDLSAIVFFIPDKKSFIVEKLKSPTEQLKTTEFAEFNNPHS